MSCQDSHSTVAQLLLGAASPTLRGTPVLGSLRDSEKSVWLDRFTDEFGHRRATDRPLLARLLGIHPSPTPEFTRLDPAAALWWALHESEFHPEALLLQIPEDEPGPLLYDLADDSITIECRTVDELAALHALWNLSIERAKPEWRSRCLRAARWHVAELQPDNATNHPWAVHVFYELAWAESDRMASAAARFHAETLLHNCRVKLGQPDLVSACILLDAANTLSRAQS